MSNQAFQTLATNKLVAQPSVASQIVFRSTSTSDTMSATTYGTISGSPSTSAKTLTGKVEVITSSSFTAVSQSILASSPVGTVTALLPGVAALGDVTGLTNPSDGDTLSIGLVGNVVIYRFKNTMSAAYDVKIGATVSDTMLHLKKAINADGTAGTDYYTGTLANPYFSATVLTTVITLTDRIACARQLAYSLTESASNFAIRTPIGGIDGIVAFKFAPGVTMSANPLTFSTEDHSTTTLPALMTGTCFGIPVGGAQAMYRIWANHTVDIRFQYSTDNTNWEDMFGGTVTVGGSVTYYSVFQQRAEYVRMIIDTNSNTTDTIMDARLVW